MAETKNYAKLAKGTAKKSTAAKKPAAKKVVKPKTPAEERDLKAKATVEKLLSNVDLSPSKDELLEFDDDTPKEGQEWLEEQVTLLTQQLEVAKADYTRIFNENQQIKSGVGIQGSDDVKTNVTKLFVELQDAFLAMGKDPQTGAPNLIIFPVAFLNKLLAFFPFLKQYKRF